MGTWVVEDLLAGHMAIPCSEVLRINRGPDGEIQSYQACIVAGGHRQVEGINYMETFSAAAKMPRVRVVLVNATEQDWEIEHVDVKSAYLNMPLEETVYMKPLFFHTTQPSHKLSNKFLGPFKILSKASSHSYTLQLPNTICGVHPVFYVSMLEPATPNEILNHVQSPPPPVDIQGKLEYEIAKVVGSKIDQHRSCKLLYLVHWLGYENTDNELSWLPATELFDFHSTYPNKPSLLSNL